MQFFYKIKFYYNDFIHHLNELHHRFDIFMISSFIFLVSFFVLSKSNPFYFLLPHKIYKLNFFKYKDIALFSFHRETKELLKFNIKIIHFHDLEKEIYYIAKIIQEPTPYLRKIDSKTEKLYFPAYSLGITKIILNNNILWIFFDENVMKKYPYQRNLTNEENFNFYENYKKALALSIFENYPEIKEIHWIEEKEIKIYHR